MVLKHHEAGFWVGSAGAGRRSAASCPAARTPRVQSAQPTHAGLQRETVSRTQDQQKKKFAWRENLSAKMKQMGKITTGDREGEDAQGAEGGRRVPKREMEGRKVGCKRGVTASQLERV